VLAEVINIYLYIYIIIVARTILITADKSHTRVLYNMPEELLEIKLLRRSIMGEMRIDI